MQEHYEEFLRFVDNYYRLKNLSPDVLNEVNEYVECIDVDIRSNSTQHQ